MKNTHSTFQTFKRQTWARSYRIKLVMLKCSFTQRLLKTYVNHHIKRIKKEVDNLNNLTIESITSNSLLSKYHFTHLYALCRLLKPHIVIETGVGLGVSSNFILHALRDNRCGELYSIDYPRSAYLTDEGIKIDEGAYTSQDNLPGFIVPDDLKKHWTLILGKSRSKLPSLCKRLKTVDLFYHDSEHTYRNMLEEYETVWPHIRKKGILASHDIDWNNAFNDFNKKNDCTPIISKDSFGFIVNN